MALSDYLLEQSSMDWGQVLSPWHQQLPPEFTLWMVNRFGDLFVVLNDGSVSVLRMDDGELKPLARDREHFAALVDAGGNANDWFLMSLVDRLTAAGVELSAGECYGFVIPPVLGGEYSIANIRPKALAEYYRFTAHVFSEITDLPDGAKVSIKLVD